MNRFWLKCSGRGRDYTKFGKQCSEEVMDYLSIDKAAVSQCVENDWRELLSKEIVNHAWSPLALRINGWRYSGPIESSLVTRSLCGAFVNPPSECATASAYFNHHGQNGLSSMGYIDYGKAFVLLAVVVILFGVLFTAYKRYLTSSVRHALREEVMLEVRTQMADYAPLDDGPSRSSKSGGYKF